MPTKQKSGLYRTKVKIGVDKNGNDVVKWISGKTKRELEDARQDIVARYIDGTKAASDRLFGDYAVEWYMTHKKPHISPSSQRAYRSMLNKHILPQFGDMNLRAITTTRLQAFVNTFAGRSESHIAVMYACLQGVFAAALADRYIMFDPALSLVRPEYSPATEKPALTDEERAAFVHLAATHKHRLYLAPMYYLGLRPGEARGLQWGDFDWQAGLVHVQRDIDDAKGGDVGELKTAASDRYIPVPTVLREILYPLRQAPSSFVVTGPRSHDAIGHMTARRWWIEIMRDAGLVDKTDYHSSSKVVDITKLYRPRFTAHTLRHNFITICWENGVDIMLTMKMVGHSDYQTTRNIYTHLSKRSMDKAKEHMDAIFSKSCTKVAQAD